MPRDSIDYKQPLPSGTYGNLQVATAKVTIDAADPVGTKVRFLRLPRGTRVIDAIRVDDGAATAAAPASTLNLGLLAAGDSTAKQNATYFLAATDLATGGKLRADQANGPVVLDDEYDVAGTIAGAAPGADTVVEVAVFYVFEGE